MSSSWKIDKQLLRTYCQGVGDLDDVFERNVPFPSLDPSDIIAVQTGSFRKLLLRQAPLDTKRSHRASEQRLDRIRGHTSSFRDDHYESTHDECYLFSCLHIWVGAQMDNGLPMAMPMSDGR